MKTTSADGVEGILLNPYHSEGKWIFRVTEKDGTFKDYDLNHSDLCVVVKDKDAVLYETSSGMRCIDHSFETMGKSTLGD